MGGTFAAARCPWAYSYPYSEGYPLQPWCVPRGLQIREGDWKVGPLPKDFQDRRVEITGPTDRKMVINALNSGGLAAVCMCVL